MGPADPFDDTSPAPGVQRSPRALPEPALASSRALTPLGFGLGTLFGLLALLIGLPGALLVMACGLIGALVGGLLDRRQALLRWIAELAQRAS